MPSSITIRQTLDPWVDDVQYIAWCEVPLESNGDLCTSKIGLGMPEDSFFIVYYREDLPMPGVFTMYDRVSATKIPKLVSYEDGLFPILTVIEGRDSYAAILRNDLRFEARRREEQIAYWKGLVAPAWNWLVLPFLQKPSNPALKSKSQHCDSIPIHQQPEYATSVSTSVPYKSNTFGLVHRRETAKVG